MEVKGLWQQCSCWSSQQSYEHLMLTAQQASGQLHLVLGCRVAQHAVSVGKGLLGMAESLHHNAELVGMLAC
jgi:hypothetical protein